MADRKEAMRQAMQELLSMGDSIKDPVSPAVVEAESALFGDLRAEGDMTVSGRFKGSLTASGTVRITGKVLGDVKGKRVILEGGAVCGGIAAEMVALDPAAILIGDVTCDRLDCAGRVKGDLRVTGAARFGAEAVLLGDVAAGTLEAHPDAQLRGEVRQTERDSEN